MVEYISKNKVNEMTVGGYVQKDLNMRLRTQRSVPHLYNEKRLKKMGCPLRISRRHAI